MIGLICPATGSLLITQRRILLANLMAHSVLPGLVLALALELDPTIGGLISGLLGALLAERLNQGFQGREEGAMNTVLAGFTALGVLLVPLLQARVDLRVAQTLPERIARDVRLGDLESVVRGPTRVQIEPHVGPAERVVH